MKFFRFTTATLLALLMTLPAYRVFSESDEKPADTGGDSVRRVERARKMREKWEALSPEEKQRVLERYREWKQMPPEAKRRLHENMERLHKLPPPAREKLLNNLKRFESMPPEV